MYTQPVLAVQSFRRHLAAPLNVSTRAILIIAAGDARSGGVGYAYTNASDVNADANAYRMLANVVFPHSDATARLLQSTSNAVQQAGLPGSVWIAVQVMATALVSTGALISAIDSLGHSLDPFAAAFPAEFGPNATVVVGTGSVRPPTTGVVHSPTGNSAVLGPLGVAGMVALVMGLVLCCCCVAGALLLLLRRRRSRCGASYFALRSWIPL